MIEFLAFVAAAILIALPWLAWVKLLAMFFDDRASGFWVFAALLVGIPVYYKAILMLLGGI